MAKIKLYTYNILETGTVTVTGTADTGYPEARLYDREIGLYWKDTVTEAKTFHIDQGSTIKDVDLLAILGHNFDGETIAWQYSDNDVDWYDAVASWVQSGNSAIVKTLETALNHRYWRLTVTSITNPMCAEIIMSLGYEFQIRFDKSPSGSKRSNVDWQESVGGIERSIKYGDRRRVRNYHLFLDVNALASIRTALDDLDENSKPFFFKDHEGYYWMCRLLDDPDESYINEGLTPLPIGVIEKL